MTLFNLYQILHWPTSISRLWLTMVQEYQSPVRVYEYPFELIMAVCVKLCNFCIVNRMELTLFVQILLPLSFCVSLTPPSALQICGNKLHFLPEFHPEPNLTGACVEIDAGTNSSTQP